MTAGREVRVRAERPGDEDAIARVNDDAFGRPGEARLIEAIRRAGHPSISLVAADGGDVVGHILFTPVTIAAPGPLIRAMGLGPMAVAPPRQRQGIGTKLATAGIDACRLAGCELLVVLGHPGFYPRFGFGPAHLLGLRSEYATPAEAFMARELAHGVLAAREGLVRYLPEFGEA